MNAAETRAEHIAPALKAAGWGVVGGGRFRREHGITLGHLHCSGDNPRRVDGSLDAMAPRRIEPSGIGLLYEYYES